MGRPKDQRILHVPRRFSQEEWGGTESVILNFCRQQQAMGLVPEIHTSQALCKVRRETWRDIPIFRYRYCYPFLGLTPEDRAALDKKGGNLLSTELFWKLLFRPDVRIYHAHVLKRMGGAVYRAARLRRKPFVVSLHGNVFDVPKDESDSITAAQEGHFEWGKPFGMLFGSRQLLDQADAVICVGYSEYEAARKALPHDRIHHLPNGVNISHFVPHGRDECRKRMGIPEGAFLFGCISRIDPQKDQKLLLRAFCRLAREHPHAHLLISGPVTSPQYASTLEAISDESGLADRIHIQPPVEPESDDHAALFASLDAFVLPSRHEPFGIVALEAWASRKPLVAASVGGLRHFVKDQENGLSFPSGDEEALLSCLRKLIEDSSLGNKLAEAGNALVRQAYSWESVVARLENIYQIVEDSYK